MIRPHIRTPCSLRQAGQVAVAVVLGCLLGVVGLPRLELPGLPRPHLEEPLAAVPAATVAPTSQPQPAATGVPALVPVPVSTPVLRPLLVERFTTPLPNWPNNPSGTAWFAGHALRLFARHSSQFVAVAAPLPDPVGDAVVSAQFRKLGGASGGGYGLIVRDQNRPSERDGNSQAGQFLVLEVGDRGDVGVWRRDQTRWIDVVPWTRSAVVHVDTAPNALSVTIRGAALRFEVNGRVVADLTYDGLPVTGNVGVFVGGDLNQVALEWLRIDA